MTAITNETELLHAYIEAKTRVVVETSTDISRDMKALRDDVNAYAALRGLPAPRFEWDLYTNEEES